MKQWWKRIVHVCTGEAAAAPALAARPMSVERMWLY